MPARTTRMGGFLTSSLAAFLIATSSAACADGPPSGSGSVLPPDERAAIEHARSLSRAFRAIARIAAPSVVSIEATAPAMVAPRGMGTGFIVSSEGHVVTNNHVVRGAAGGSLKVRLHDGREAQASVVGTDPETDIAVLKVELDGLDPIEFGDSDAAEPGDWVIALGSPFGLKDSVTAGIISAKGREVGLSPLESYLQTDATINPGNSGGPLVDMDGRVVGINTAIESRSGGSDGIGFAIPSTMAKGVVESIIGGGSPARGFLGIQMQPLDPQMAASFEFRGSGVLVSQVVPGGAADRAGVRAGDILVKVNGDPTPSMQRVMRAVRLCAPGADCPIEVFRDGEAHALVARLDDASRQVASLAQPGPRVAAPTAPARRAAPVPPGIEVAAITAELAKERGIADLRGVVVTSVLPNSPAARAGLRAGDIVRQVGGSRVQGPDEWESIMRSTMGRGRSVRLLVEREGNATFLLMRA